MEKLLIVIPALRITVKPALGDHQFVKLKVVAQNRWSFNEGLLTGTGVMTCEFLTYQLCKRQLADTVYHQNGE